MVQRTQADNPHALTHEKSGDMDLANMLAESKKTPFPNDTRSQIQY